jgi:fucose permease
MWSIVFSLALNSVSRYHGAFSGILCTGITGGAIVPSLVGQLADHVGLRSAMLAVFVTLGYILSVSFWARPLIRNETVGISELFNVRKKSSQASPG